MPIVETDLNAKIEELETVVNRMKTNYKKAQNTLSSLYSVKLVGREETVEATATETEYIKVVFDQKPIDRSTQMPISDSRRTELYEECLSQANKIIKDNRVNTTPDDDTNPTEEG